MATINAIGSDNPIEVTKGGTGLSSPTDHAVLVGSGPADITPIAVGVTNQVLLGNTGADPSWGTVSNNALTNSSITLSDGNNITVTGSPVSLGGTASFNLTGTTDHAIQLGNATGSLTSLAVAGNGEIPIGSVGADPVLAIPTNGANITWTVGAGTLQADLTGTTDHTVQVGNAAGSLTSLAVAGNGELIIGSAGVDPVLATITAGAGINVANAAGSITISSTGGLVWSVITGATQAMAVNNGYIANRAAGIVFTLPTTAAVGDRVRVTGILGIWSIAQNTGETIYFGSDATTTGAGGSLTTTIARGAVELVCVVADTDWQVLAGVCNMILA